MPEEIAFARKASGLVRGLSMYDAFGIGLMLVVPIYSIWYTIQVGLAFFPGANLYLTMLISLVLCGVTGPIVWGILSGSMPRSGGEYIYNSRIINPAVAMGASFAQIIAVLYWNFFISTWIASPALQILGQYMGWTGLSNWVATKAGTFTCALACYVGAFFCIAFGMRIYKMIQRPLTVVAFGGVALLAVSLSLATKSSFIKNWNQAASRYHSLSYNHFITAAGAAAGHVLPHTWNWGDTIGATTGAFMLFIYIYAIAYVSGEVKRPDKSLMIANYLTVVVPVALAIWTFVALYHIVDFNFLSAAAFNDYSGGIKGYALPYSTSYMSLTFIASGFNRVIGVVAALTFLVGSFWLIVVSLLIPQRALFAWGMDRMGPKWFTNVSSKYGSPVLMYLFVTAISALGTAAYVLWFPSILSGLVAAGMQLVSLFGVTAIAAIIFPYRKKVKTIWDSSPFRRWTVFGVPVVTIAGVIYLCYICLLLYYAFLDSKTRDATGRNLILFAAAWALGISWYFIWKRRAERTGVAASVTYGELPPE